MLKVACPKCGIKLSAPPEYAGRKVSCQQCKTQFVLPEVGKPDPPPKIATAPVAPESSAPQTAAQAPAQVPDQIPRVAESPGSASDPRFAQPTPNPYNAEPPTGIEDQLSSISNTATKPMFSQSLAGDLIESRSLKSLFDFKFRYFLSPTLVRISWVLTLVVSMLSIFGSVIFLVLGVIAASSQGMDPLALASLVGVFAGWVLYTLLLLLGARIIHEMVMLVFNVAGTLKSIDSKVGE